MIKQWDGGEERERRMGVKGRIGRWGEEEERMMGVKGRIGK